MLDADSPEHYYAFTDYEATSKLTTFGELYKYIEKTECVRGAEVS